jgi:putative aldouronate transport system substrate-binding protein
MNFKKMTLLVLSVLMVLVVFTGCTSNKDTAPSSSPSNEQTKQPVTKLEPVTLKIMFWGNRPADMDKVLQEAERRMADTLNVKLDVVISPVMDYFQKSQMTLAAGESVDLVWDSSLMHMDQMIASGFFEPLDDLLQKYGPNIIATRSKEMFDGNKVGGITYGIPLGSAQFLGSTYLVRQDIREKLGIAPIKSYDDLIKFAYAVKEKEKNVVPLLPSQSVFSEAAFRSAFDYDTQIRSTQALTNNMLYYKNNDGKVYNLLDQMEPKVWDWITNARKLYNDKIIHPDVLAIKDYEAEFKSGKIAIIPTHDFGVKDSFKQAIEKNVPGGKVEAVTFFDPTVKKNISNFKQWNLMFVPVSSKNKERAIQFLNWTQEKDNYDLLAYGIKGVDWEPVGEDQYKSISDGYSWFPYSWIWNPKLDRMNASDSEDVKKLNSFLKDANNFERDILTGFQFNAEPIVNELTKYKTIEDNYYTPIFNGVVDPDQYFAKFKSEAGPTLKKIQQELQKQIDAFLKK